MSFVKVAGTNNKHKVRVFTISTCGWCKKMKRLLKSLNVEYEYADLDTLSEEEEDGVRAEMEKYNPHMATPTLIIDDGKEVIVGFLEDKVRRFFEDGG